MSTPLKDHLPECFAYVAEWQMQNRCEAETSDT